VGSSLQEQLLKAGLVDEERLKQATRQKHKRTPKKAKAERRQPPPTPTPEQIEQRERERELNAQREEVRRQREVNAQVRQLVSRNRHPRVEGDDDIPFHFENKGKIKRLYVSPATHRLISERKLVIVNDNGMFELVPPPIAEKIRQRNPSLVIDLPDEQAPAEDDPYAAYKVPDDLMW
jgi:uncharacterized protein YaiL (DUF2058 family)